MPRKPNSSNDRYNDPFPTRLRELVGERGTKQEELKNVLCVKNRQSVTGYIDGSTVPTIDKVVALAKYYGVNADYLLGLSGIKSPNPNIQVACDCTGLSEKAVVRLITMINCNRVLASSVIESPYFGGMEYPRVEGLIDYLDEAITTCNEVGEMTETLSSCFDDAGKLQNEKLYEDTYTDLIFRLRELRGLKFEVMEAAAKILNDLQPVDKTITRAQETMEISNKRLGRQAEELASNEK